MVSLYKMIPNLGCLRASNKIVQGSIGHRITQAAVIRNILSVSNHATQYRSNLLNLCSGSEGYTAARICDKRVVQDTFKIVAQFTLDVTKLRMVPSVAREGLKLLAKYRTTPEDSARKPEDMFSYMNCEDSAKLYVATEDSTELARVERFLSEHSMVRANDVDLSVEPVLSDKYKNPKILLSALAILAAQKLKPDEDECDKLDPLEVSTNCPDEDITLESTLKTCKVCRVGNISPVLRNGKLNSTKIVIYTRDGTVNGHHLEKRCTKKSCRAGAYFGFSVVNGKRWYDDDVLNKPYLIVTSCTAFHRKYCQTPTQPSLTQL